MFSAPPYVGRFKREATLKLALHREVHADGIRGFEPAINAVGVESKPCGVWVVRWSRRVADAGIGGRKNVDGDASSSQIARSVVGRKNVGRGCLCAGQPERAKLAEAVHDPFAEMIVVHANASSDGALVGTAEQALQKTIPEAW